MEVPLVEGGINQLKNPEFVAQFSDLVSIVGIPSFWTWSSLFLAAIATLGSLLTRKKLITRKLRRVRSVISQPLTQFSSDSDSDDEEDDDTCSSSSSDDDEEEDLSRSRDDYPFRDSGEEEVEENGKTVNWLPNLARGKGVVKAWDALGLGFGGYPEGFISVWDLNRGGVVRSFPTGSGGDQISAACMPSPSVIVSAGAESEDRVALRVWDSRIGCQIPAALAEWQPGLRRRVLGFGTGAIDKLVYVRDDVMSYVRDDVMSAAVVDLRSVGRASGEGTWWDTVDAVVVGGDGAVFDDVAVMGRSSRRSSDVASWCRSAVSCLPLLSLTK